MKQITIIGATDKRAILYPLLKVTMALGKTLVISDEGVLRRFSEDYSTRFGFENAEFIITPQLTEEIEKEVEEIRGSFEYIIFATNNELPRTASDKVIYTRGVNKNIATEDVLDRLEKVEHTEVYVTFSRIKDPKLLKITPSKSIMEYIYSCEEEKAFLGTKNGGFAQMLEKFFIDELDIPRATIKGLLLRKG